MFNVPVEPAPLPMNVSNLHQGRCKLLRSPSHRPARRRKPSACRSPNSHVEPAAGPAELHSGRRAARKLPGRSCRRRAVRCRDRSRRGRLRLRSRPTGSQLRPGQRREAARSAVADEERGRADVEKWSSGVSRHIADRSAGRVVNRLRARRQWKAYDQCCRSGDGQRDEGTAGTQCVCMASPVDRAARHGPTHCGDYPPGRFVVPCARGRPSNAGKCIPRWHLRPEKPIGPRSGGPPPD